MVAALNLTLRADLFQTVFTVVMVMAVLLPNHPHVAAEAAVILAVAAGMGGVVIVSTPPVAAALVDTLALVVMAEANILNHVATTVITAALGQVAVAVAAAVILNAAGTNPTAVAEVEVQDFLDKGQTVPEEAQQVVVAVAPAVLAELLAPKAQRLDAAAHTISKLVAPAVRMVVAEAQVGLAILVKAVTAVLGLFVLFGPVQLVRSHQPAQETCDAI
jgi:hypothetical protein